MAVQELHKKLDVTDAVTLPTLSINPKEVIADFSRRGRKFPPTPEEIVTLANKMLKYGQEQAVKFQRTPDKKVKLIFGFTRYQAAMWIVENHPDRNFKLRGEVIDCNDAEALQHNIAENRDRKETSIIDNADNQRRLREELGWTDVQIAEEYGQTVAWVGQIRDLLLYDEPEQLLIHNKKFPISSALALMKLPAEDRKKIIVEATDGTGRVRGAKVTSLMRDWMIEHNHSETDANDGTAEEEDDDAELGEQFAAQLQAISTGGLPLEGAAASASGAVEETGDEAGEQPAGPKKKKAGRQQKDSVARSVKDLRRFLTDYLEESDDPALREFLKKTSAWVEGKATDQQYKNAHLKLLKATPMPPQPKETAAAETKEPEPAGAA